MSEEWWDGAMAAFDTETTGVDVEVDRIVTMHLGGSDWLLNPGVPIPEEATAIHGVTTARAIEDGLDPRPALAAVHERLVTYATHGVPLVGHNVSFDLTVLDREFRRHLPYAAAIPATLCVVDTLVLDKHVDQYRKGSRRLDAVAAHYGVTLDDAHDAAADAQAAVEVARAILARYADALGVAAVSPYLLHVSQVRWRWSQQASLQEWLRRKDPETFCEPWWPVYPSEGSR